MFLSKINWSKSQIVNQKEKTQKNIYKYKNITINLKRSIIIRAKEDRSLFEYIVERLSFLEMLLKILTPQRVSEKITEEKNKNRWNEMTYKLSKIVIFSFP